MLLSPPPRPKKRDSNWVCATGSRIAEGYFFGGSVAPETELGSWPYRIQWLTAGIHLKEREILEFLRAPRATQFSFLIQYGTFLTSKRAARAGVFLIWLRFAK